MIIRYKGVIGFVVALMVPVFAQAGVLDALRTAQQVKQAKGLYDSVQSIRAVEGMENAQPIYTKVKKIYVSAAFVPKGGDTGKLNELVEDVVCDNIDRIVDNLEKYDLEGATPGCKTGLPKDPGKKRIVQLKLEQDTHAANISITATSVETSTGQVLKTLKIENVENYLVAVEKLVDDIHGDLVLSSRTKNPISLRKWPSRFNKYSKKKKHRKVEIKRKYRKQLEANMVN